MFQRGNADYDNRSGCNEPEISESANDPTLDWPVDDAVAQILKRVQVANQCKPGGEGLMNPIVSRQSIRTAQSVRETINQDGAVLLDIKQGLCFSMNPVGTRIWEMLKRERSLNEIASALEEEFNVPRRQIEADIAEFMQSLKARNLVEDPNQNNEEKNSWIARILRRARRFQNR